MAARGRESGIRGLQCGIVYQDLEPDDPVDGLGVDIFSWSLCADLEFITPGVNLWPRPCGGTIITWAECQTGEVAVAGYFYMAAYGTDDLVVRSRPVDGLAKVANCEFEEIILQGADLGRVSFSPGASRWGCNPCTEHCGSDIPPGVEDPCAVSFESGASLGLHVTASLPASCAAGSVSCSEAAPAGAVAPGGHGQYVSVIADRGTQSPIREMKFGITYGNGELSGRFDGTGVDVVSWHSCAPVASPTPLWPAPGSGITLSWPDPECNASKPLLAGYFYVAGFSEDRIHITPHPGEERARVVRCDESSADLPAERLGNAAFGSGAAGCNPCSANCEPPIAVKRTTWGGIKALFAD